jgi:hypothetical protein
MTQWGIDTLFNPGKRHLDDEKRRLQSTREEVGDASGGRRIDLDSGKLVIRRKQSGEAESVDPEREPERYADDEIDTAQDAPDSDATETIETDADDDADAGRASGH